LNLRQKAKHYKRLAELYGARTIQPNIIYQQLETKHLRSDFHFDPSMDDIEMLIRLNEDRLIEEVRQMISTKVFDDDIFRGKRIQSDIWIVDKR